MASAASASVVSVASATRMSDEDLFVDHMHSSAALEIDAASIDALASFEGRWNGRENINQMRKTARPVTARKKNENWKIESDTVEISNPFFFEITSVLRVLSL